MGRICAVDGCDSGTYKNLALRQAAGLAPLVLFSIPKRNNALKTWSDALRRKLLQTDFICEQHFAEDDVIKVDKTVLHDGTVHIIPRQKAKLVANATPITSITEKMSFNAENTTAESRELAVQQRDPLEIQQQMEREALHLQQQRKRDPLQLQQQIEHVPLQVPPHRERDSLQLQKQREPQLHRHDHEQIRENRENMQMNHREHIVQSQSNNNLLLDLPPTPKVSYPRAHESPNTQSLRFETDMSNSDFFGLGVRESESNGTVNHEVPNVVSADTGTTEMISESPMDIQENVEFNVPADADTNADADGSWTDVCSPFTIDKVFDCLRAVTLLPQRWCWMSNRRDEESIVFLQLDTYTQTPSARVVLYNDLSVTVQTADEKVSMELDETITSVDSLEKILKNISKQVICCGTGMDEESRAESCLGIVPLKKYKRHVITPRCHFCQKVRIRIQNRENKRQTNPKVLCARWKQKATRKRRVCKRLHKKVKSLRQRIVEAHEKCAAVEKEALQEAISALDPAQQEAVIACFSNSKVACATQRRYRIDWVYECLLMRIKNSKLYDHLRSRNILPLPCRDTLNKYIQKLGTSYGFQQPVFDCLKLKASRMESVEKRGTLLIDEMSISEAINFDRKTMEFSGFVDLGEHTPIGLQNERADHALVFMFQPFRGVWVQALGCFLSKNSVTSQILHKLILECLMKLAHSGFHVDVITMDGAQWNRGVWKLFGIKDGTFSCQHPCDDKRRLWMISDFPHLIKCFRNGIMAPKNEHFTTPHGTVKKQHWKAVIDHEGRGKPNMKIAYKLTDAHLDPKGYEKMNVPLAFELFSDRVRVAMEFYKDNPRCPRLRDSTPTIELIRVVDDLIRAMMSRKPSDALRPTDTCPQKKAIERFLEYLRTWETVARSTGTTLPISASTLTGLKVTLKGTLELIEFLHEEYNFDFLMTARLNQDALERFFGMMRSACGSNDHPDPLLFAQVFRLICSYSLVKPPRGSNVSGSELLQTLMQTKESLNACQQRKEQLLTKIDAAVDAGRFSAPANPTLAERASQDHCYEDTQSVSSHSHVSVHDYDVTRTSEEVLALVSGYVARRIRSASKCEDCVKRLVADEPCHRDEVTQLLSRYNGLLYPSEELFKLLKTLESVVLEVVGKLTVKTNTLLQIVEKVSEMKNLTRVGCVNHESEVTVKVINFYLLMRGSFLANSVNANCNAKKMKTKMHRKQAKL